MSGREGLFAFVLGLSAVAHGLNSIRAGEGVDFFHYWMVPHLLAVGVGPDIYAPNASDQMRIALIRSLGRDPPPDPYRDRAASYWREFQITNTPFCYLMLTPFATRDFATGYFAFQHVSLACLVGGIFAFGRLCGLPWLDCVVAFAAAVFCFECVASDIRVGNLNRLLLGWLAAAAWCATHARMRWQSVAAGVLFGLAAVFKPIVGLVCLTVPAFRLASGDRRRALDESLGVAIGLVAGVVTPMFTMGTGIWQAWLSHVRSFDWLTHSRVDAGNVSLVELLAELGWPDIGLVLLAMAGGVVGLACIVIHRRRCHGVTGHPFAHDHPADLVAGLALGLLLYLLTARLTWLHYYVLSLPALLFLAARMRAGRPAWMTAAALTAAMAIALKPIVETMAANGAIFTMGVMVVGGWLAFVLVLWEVVAAKAPCTK